MYNGKLSQYEPEKPEIPISIKNPKLWWPHNLRRTLFVRY